MKSVNSKQLIIWSIFNIGLLTASTHAAIVTLDFSSLPSAQGWVFEPNGAVSENDVFSVDGTKLIQNAIGQGTVIPRYVLDNVIDPLDPFSIAITARVLQTEVLSVSSDHGFGFFAQTGTEVFGIAISPNSITDVGVNFITAAFDNTQFHDYQLDITPGVGYDLFIDGQFVSSGSPFLAVTPNRLLIGDGTFGENAEAEISSFTFTQGAVIPEPSTYAMMLLGILGMGWIRPRIWSVKIR